jgi:hypothetical protein
MTGKGKKSERALIAKALSLFLPCIHYYFILEFDSKFVKIG